MIVAPSNATQRDPPDPSIALGGEVNTLETVRKKVLEGNVERGCHQAFPLQANGLYKL
jgi:hypothetical protein